ncbi:MAG TPA: hypothetical protein VKX28_26965 [Xanthobacteraceae bacterium]|nr:hypothetical protein [Xanthobacteraceae bacterium]
MADDQAREGALFRPWVREGGAVLVAGVIVGRSGEIARVRINIVEALGGLGGVVLPIALDDLRAVTATCLNPLCPHGRMQMWAAARAAAAA